MTELPPDDTKAIERAIAAVESATGAQVVAAVVPRADDYPEAPWRAFALGVSLAALATWWLDAGAPDWMSPTVLLWQALLILGAGALSGLAARYVPWLRRRFVRPGRAEQEVRQCAEALFLARELFATPERTAVLILVAELERRVVVVPDAGYRGRIAHAQWEAVVDAMTPALRDGNLREAFERGLAALQALLTDARMLPGDRVNRLADALLRGDAP